MLLILKAILNWVWPTAMLALGIYLLSGSVLTLIYGGMMGVGAFVLGVRLWSRVSDDFREKTEAILKGYTQVETQTPAPAPVTIEFKDLEAK